MSDPENRSLKMHPRLLYDVISRQAGTLSKSIMEGVMNSIDAGATFCDITLDAETFTIDDDGKGFQDRTEIENFFETFGYPHGEGDAVYGRFRMGRGQMMAFGVNTWTTNQFRMTVDIKPQKDQTGKEFALGYQLSEVGEIVPGCHINVALYTKLNKTALLEASREITSMMAYAQIPVRLNGQQINQVPRDVKWDVETEDAYFKFSKSGMMSIYNLGVLVNSAPSRNFGTGGEVVSKHPLEVNFARNAVISDCKVYGRIQRTIAAEAAKQFTGGTGKMDDAAYERLATQILTGEVNLVDVLRQKVLTDIFGRRQPLSWLKGEWNMGQVSVATTGDQVAEIAHSRKLALVLAQDTLDRFGMKTVQDLMDALAGLAEQQIATTSNRSDKNELWIFQSGIRRLDCVDRKTFDDVISSTHIPVADKELNAAEAFALDIIRSGTGGLGHEMAQAAKALGNPMPPRTLRKLSVGVSEAADAWTDGTENIWINRKILPLIKLGTRGFVRISGLVAHEYLHDDADTGSHIHDAEFYQRFHDLVLDTDILGHAADKMLKKVKQQLLMAQRRPGGVLAGLFERDAVMGVLKLDGLNNPEGPEVAEPAEADQEEVFVVAPRY